MGMSTGGDSNAVNSEINVTPMIDVLLVLLIIFMVVQAMSRTSVEMIIPPIETQSAEVAVSDQIVLEMRDDGSNWINGTVGPIAMDNLEAQLHELYDNRPTKLLFLKPGLDRKYNELIEAVDIGRGAGVQVFGFTPIEAY